MDEALCHGQRAIADIDRQQQFALRVDGRPYPVGGAFKALDGVVLTEFTVFDVTQHGIQLVQLQLVHVYIAEKVREKAWSCSAASTNH